MKPTWLDSVMTFVSQYLTQNNISTQERYLHINKSTTTVEYTQTTNSNPTVQQKEVLHVVIDLNTKEFNFGNIKIIATLESSLAELVPENVYVSVFDSSLYDALVEDDSYGY